MPVDIGRIEAIFRYPVKSMRGELLDAATLGWHGLEGDRRLAFRRMDERGGFPWLSASQVPALIIYTPRCLDAAVADGAPTHVVTPGGEEMLVFGEALAAEVGRRYGGPVEMMRLRNGIFDDGAVSMITTDTIGEICRLAARPADGRRFRPNIVVRSTRGVPFEEGDWLGGTLVFGEGADAPAVAVTSHDVRCSMVNIDPDDASLAPEVMKAVVRANHNNAGSTPP